MFITKPKKFTLTLFVYVALVFTLAASSEAKSFQHHQHRDHVNLKRLIKKRSPFPQTANTPLIPVAGAAPPPPSFSVESASSSSLSSSSTASSSEASTTSASSASEASQSTLASESSASTSQSVSESASSTQSSSTSTTQPSTTAAQTSEQLNLSGATPTPSVEVIKPTFTKTQSVDAAESTDTPVPKAQSNASKANSTTLTVIIIVAASVAGIAILWTVFRKWKLGSSKKFDERLQPIDWQPTNQDDGAGIIPPHRRASTGASSFHSGSGHGHAHGSDHGHNSGIPDHDFTAGPSTLAPVGGYADLARGSSPQPQMHQMNRGPSLTRPAYDIGVPLHHQAGYGTQDAYDYPDARRY